MLALFRNDGSEELLSDHAGTNSPGRTARTSASRAARVKPRHHRGLVPLSADPITFGHLDIIAHASAACDDVVVFIGNSDDKLGRY